MTNTTELSEAKRALLEKYIRGRLPQSTKAEKVIPRRAEGSIVPLSFSQQQMWLLAQLIPDTPVYNESVTIHLPGPLNVAALEQSFNEVIRRHEAWRTTFPFVNGQPVQMIHPATTLILPVVDLRHLPGAEREAEAIRIATEKALLPFDLAQGPLLRATLMQLDDEDYRLFLTMHHIIFDGTIYQVFLPELRALYEAFSAGRPSSLPELPIQYADFAVWQRERLQEGVLADQLDYWKRQLMGASTVLDLPGDCPRPATQNYRGDRHFFALSRHLTEEIKALSRREGVTLYMILVAAFQVLLHRYTGQNDILIGTTTGGHKPAEAQGLLGFFLNTLVLRTNLSGTPTFRELLMRVREVTLEAHAHQDLPFEYLVKELQPERNLAHNAIIQVMLSLEPPLPILSSGWTMTLTDVQKHTALFDLCLELDERPEGLVGWFEYRTDLFDESTIDRMAGHWQMLLEGIVDNIGQCIEDMPLLTETERQLLLVELNATQTAYHKDQCIHRLFEAQVGRTPDAVALVLEEHQLTYQQLNSQANQLAHHLQLLGVGPEVLVGICLERSVEMVVGLLAILKAGGAFVPLDPAYPQEQLAFMLRDSQIAVLVTQQRLLEQLPHHDTQVLCLDTDGKVITQASIDNPRSAVTGEHLAYVIYTSGSTGTPKGVLISHKSLAIHCETVKSCYELSTSDRVLQFSVFSFDAALEQLFPPLLTGASVILRGPEVWSATELQQKIAAFGLTVINLPTAYWNHVTQAWAATSNVSLPQQLRLVIVGGDRVLPQYVELWQQLPTQEIRLLNAYGPTETTITATLFEITRRLDSERSVKSIPIGRPLAHRTSYILDAYGNPVPIGVPGELYLGGELLARGYLNRPELTAEKFIVNPFSTDPNARLYRTGDVARYLPDGNIEFIGRMDQQVKIRGFRIELGEIESMLGQHPGVREVVVVARENSPGDKHLVAYLVQDARQPLTFDEVHRFMKEKLPEYMVPSAFVLLDAFPLLPNGKVDRQMLPAPDQIRLTLEGPLVVPTSMLHQQLIQIWEELLDVRPIGIRNNFFYLGGHSLLAARLVNRIEQVFGKKLSLATLFAGPTIEQLANVLQGQENSSNSRTPAIAVQTSDSKRPFFFLHADWESGAFYCFPLARDLGSEQPFYVLEPYKFDGLHVPPTFEAMAAAHIESLRAIQPEGPYLLGGFCSGGLVAYEIAQQLYKQGQVVELLVLMDPGSVTTLTKVARSFIQRIGSLIRLGQEKQLDVFLRLHYIFNYLRLSDYRKLHHFLLFPTTQVLRQNWFDIFAWIASGYVPRQYPGKVTFFWAKEEFNTYKAAWRKFEKGREAHIIPGTHMSCRTEHLHTLAEHLSMCISKAQKEVI